MNTINYIQTIPNSHHWPSLNTLLNNIKYHSNEFTKKYLLIGFNNCIKHGYKIKQIKNLDLNQLNNVVFLSIDNIINYINNDNTPDFNDFLNKFSGIIETTINVGFDLTNELKLEKYEVYKRIDVERDYQNMYWNNNHKKDNISIEDKQISEWLNYIEYHLNKAKKRNYHLNNNKTLSEIRKIAALTMKCLEIHGCPERKLSNNDTIKNVDTTIDSEINNINTKTTFGTFGDT